jgi:hypothetical protein
MRNAVEMQGCEFYLQEDWDGEGATAVSPITLNNAQVVTALLPDSLPYGSVMAGSDGSIGVSWHFFNHVTGHNATLYVDFRANGRIRYYFARKGSDGNRESNEHVIPAGTSLEEILDILSPCFPWFER